MGFFKGLGLFILGISLFTILTMSALTWTVSSSLEYNSSSEHIYSVVNEISSSSGIDSFIEDNHEEIQLICKNDSKNYTFKAIEISIPCKEITKDANTTVEKIKLNIVDQFYYKKYNCTFKTCLKEPKNFPYYISNNFKEFLKSKLFWMFFIFILISIAYLFLLEKKNNFFFILGTFTILSSLPIKLISLIPNMFSNKLFAGIILSLFNKSQTIFIYYLIAGGIFLLLGFIFKFFDIGMKVSKWIEKISPKKETDKEEIEKKE